MVLLDGFHRRDGKPGSMTELTGTIEASGHPPVRRCKSGSCTSAHGPSTAGWLLDHGTWYYMDPHTGAMRMGWARSSTIAGASP